MEKRGGGEGDINGPFLGDGITDEMSCLCREEAGNGETDDLRDKGGERPEEKAGEETVE